MKHDKLCLQCGTIGSTKRMMKGSILTELFLWIFFIVPGLIYTIWRHCTVYQGCRQCGSANVIPTDSPRARELGSGWFCTACGKRSEIGSKFCVGCGHAIEA